MFHFIINMTAIVIIGLFMVVDLINKILLILLSILKTVLHNALKKRMWIIILTVIFILASCSKTYSDIQLVVSEQLATNSQINRYIVVEIPKTKIEGRKMSDIFDSIQDIDNGAFKVVDVVEKGNSVLFTLDRYAEKPPRNTTTIVPIYIHQ